MGKRSNELGDYMDKMKVGDCVRLNSGGPVLVVTSVADDLLICHWFDGKNLKQASFYPVMLTKV